MTTPSTVTPLYLPSNDQLGLVAIGFSGGQCKPGVEAAPNALIAAGLAHELNHSLGYQIHYEPKCSPEYTPNGGSKPSLANTKHELKASLEGPLYHDIRIHDYAEILPVEDPPVQGMLRPLAVSAVTKRLASQVYEHAKEGRLVLNLGGDHSIAIGTIAGCAKAVKERTGKAMNVIWVDAHADINTPETSPSGNIHGMPVAFLTGIAKPDPVFGWLKGLSTNGSAIEPRRVVYIGLRDVDVGEKKIIREHKIKAFSMHDVDRWGIGRCMEMALEYLASLDRDDRRDHVPGQQREGGGYFYPGLGPVYLSIDVDALDPTVAPSTGTPVRGGLTLREGDFICECVHATGTLVGMDLVEVNPIADGSAPDSVGAKETVRAGCSLVRCALGESLL